jgi:hypothetical protein
MGHRVFISLKAEDAAYKSHIQAMPNMDFIDKSLNVPINSIDEDYIMRAIRTDYLSSSTVTIFLIGNFSAESLGEYEQRFIKRELQASLYDGAGNSKNGILGIVLPSMQPHIYLGSFTCSTCGESHTNVGINDATTIKEFSYNYYIPNSNCSWNAEDRYCILVKWEEFLEDSDLYINAAHDKRETDIASKTKVRP